MRRLMTLVATGLLVAACGGLGAPGFTIPPINIPTIPPIDLPSGGIPLPGFSMPPSATPCTLVTGAEVGQILGAAVTDSSSSSGDCIFILPNFSTVSVSTDSSTDLTGVQFLMGESAQQTTIGGFPALVGSALGLPAVYVQKPNGQLQILGFAAGSDPAMSSKLQQIAALAVTRMP